MLLNLTISEHSTNHLVFGSVHPRRQASSQFPIILGLWYGLTLQYNALIFWSIENDAEHRLNLFFHRIFQTSLVEHYGYPIEQHDVKTRDGYILTMHRIPHGRIKNDRRRKIPIYLQHGLFASASSWVLNDPDESLGNKWHTL